MQKTKHEHDVDEGGGGRIDGLRDGCEIFVTSPVSVMFDERQQQQNEQHEWKKLMKSEIFNPV